MLPNLHQKPRPEKPDGGGKRVTFASLHWSGQWLVLFDGWLVGNCVTQYLFERRLDWGVNFVKSFLFSTGFLLMCYAHVYWQNRQSKHCVSKPDTK